MGRKKTHKILLTASLEMIISSAFSESSLYCRRKEDLKDVPTSTPFFIAGTH